MSLSHGSASTDHTSPAITDTHKHHTSGAIRAQETAEAEADGGITHHRPARTVAEPPALITHTGHILRTHTEHRGLCE